MFLEILEVNRDFTESQNIPLDFDSLGHSIPCPQLHRVLDAKVYQDVYSVINSYNSSKHY